MKQKFIVLFIAAFVAGAGLAFGDTVLQIERVESKINSGFKERIYIDRKEKLTLANGKSGTVTVPDGTHTIYAELYTMKTNELSFTASGGTLTIKINANSLKDFEIALGSAGVIRDSAVAAFAASNALAAAVNDGGVEGSLARGAQHIMDDLTPHSRIAIVFVTAKDPEVAEFIAEELEFIMVDQKFTLIDRSQLDRIRKEQNFQLSGEVDDAQAVNVGKLSGANVIITGAVTGTGDLRRLRLRALDTQTAQVITTASEKY